MRKILVIAPYPGLRDLFIEVNNEMNKELDIHYGDLYEGLQLAKSLEREGYDVIISRGATAQLLREHCSLPIVDVNFSTYDILRALKIMKEFPGKKGIMSYFNVVRGADEIGKLIDLDLQYYPVNGADEMTVRVSEAINEGVETIIGDAVSTAYAKQNGLRTILITSGRESVMDAIYAAEQIAFYTEREKEKIRRFNMSFDNIQNGVVVYDQHGNVQHTNQVLHSLLGVTGGELTQEYIKDNFPFLSIDKMLISQEIEEFTVRLNNQRFKVIKKPIFHEETLIGAVVIAQSEHLDYHRATPLSASVTFNQLIGINGPLEDLINIAKKMSQSTLPIMIYGEDGTGKNNLAQAIHNESKRRSQPFVYFNCSAYSQYDCEEILFGSDGNDQRLSLLEQAHGGTLYLKDIDQLSLDIQDELANVLESGMMMRLNDHYPMNVSIRLIASSNKKLKQMYTLNQITPRLYNILKNFTLSLPPLRHRLEEIYTYSMNFIAMYNQRTEKQIVGLTHDVVEKLQGYKWPGNLSELKFVIYKLCEKSKGPYIQFEEAEDVIQKWMVSPSKQKHDLLLNINGKTLQEIETEVITQLLEKEGFNQSRVAKLLGINRTTLWRKLN